MWTVASSILLLADEADIDVSVYMEMLQREARYAENLSTLLHVSGRAIWIAHVTLDGWCIRIWGALLLGYSAFVEYCLIGN